MNVIMCGGRNWDNAGKIQDAFDLLGPGKHRIIQGGASGADNMSKNLATSRGIEVITYDADWKKHGRAAGPIRNQKMLEQGNPDEVFAFWDGKSRGTLDMISRAVKGGIPVRIFPEKG